MEWAIGSEANTSARSPRTSGRGLDKERSMPRSVCERFLDDVLDGLRRRPRSIPCKYLYDERGSRLFDRICELGDYYLTRAEIAILSTCAADIAAEIGPRTLLVELGSGSSTKSPLLLEAFVEPVGYLPIDISEEHLLRAAGRTAQTGRASCR